MVTLGRDADGKWTVTGRKPAFGALASVILSADPARTK